jgi:acyl-CoA thioesterase-2
VSEQVDSDFGMADLWELQEAGADRFLADPPGKGFLFGGQTMALLLRAAGRTVANEQIPKSLHCSFMRAGRWGDPLELSVARVSDTRSFSHRVVSANQGDATLAQAAISFHRPDDDADLDHHLPAPTGPAPGSLSSDTSTIQAAPGVIDVRPLAGPRPEDRIRRIHPYWARPHGPVTAEPLLSDCVTTFISDYMVVTSSHEGPEPLSHMVTTLSHTIWFHRESHPESWLVYDAEVLSEVGGRFVSRGTVHDVDGRLIASFVQEVVKRPPRGA